MTEGLDDHYGPFKIAVPDFEEAAPSTDEGEAQEGGRTLTIEEARIELYDSLPHPFSCGGREQPRTYYAQTCTCYARDVVEAFEAAIRAPLEERIRELELTFATCLGILNTEYVRGLQAEVEKLREALENVRRVMHLPRAEDAANRAVDIATAALRPPLSTEGTDDEPTFDRLSMHRSEDWGTKEVEG